MSNIYFFTRMYTSYHANESPTRIDAVACRALTRILAHTLFRSPILSTYPGPHILVYSNASNLPFSTPPSIHSPPEFTTIMDFLDAHPSHLDRDDDAAISRVTTHDPRFRSARDSPVSVRCHLSCENRRLIGSKRCKCLKPALVTCLKPMLHLRFLFSPRHRKSRIAYLGSVASKRKNSTRVQIAII